MQAGIRARGIDAGAARGGGMLSIAAGVEEIETRLDIAA